MKKTTALIAGLSLLCLTSTAWATSYSFTFESTFGDLEVPTDTSSAEYIAYEKDKLIYGPNEVLASADMDIEIIGNTVTVILKNTSPALLSDNRANAPGIVGFGFDINPDTLTLTNWSLSAFDLDGISVEIGGSGSTDDWVLASKVSNIKVDYMPATGDKDQDIKGALYNPDAVGSAALAAAPNYFTLATLSLTFDDMPTLDFTDVWSPFIRMQNVGPDGEYSLKMTPSPVPEPATMLLFGTGLAGVAGFARKKYKA